MDGKYYNWIERPFIGVWLGFYYFTIALIMLLTVIVVAIVVPTTLVSVISILAPCIPCGGCVCCSYISYYLCCKRKSKPSRGRRRGSRYGNNRARGRGGVSLTISPPGGKGSGVPPKLSSQRSGSLQRASSPNKLGRQ